MQTRSFSLFLMLIVSLVVGCSSNLYAPWNTKLTQGWRQHTQVAAQTESAQDRATRNAATAHAQTPEPTATLPLGMQQCTKGRINWSRPLRQGSAIQVSDTVFTVRRDGKLYVNQRVWDIPVGQLVELDNLAGVCFERTDAEFIEAIGYEEAPFPVYVTPSPDPTQAP